MIFSMICFTFDIAFDVNILRPQSGPPPAPENTVRGARGGARRISVRESVTLNKCGDHTFENPSRQGDPSRFFCSDVSARLL